jgi:hypothetical protein
MEVINTTSTVDPLNMYDKLNSFMLNPVVIIIALLVIVAYFVLFSSLGNSENSTGEGINMNDSTSSSGKNILGIIVIIVLVLLILVNAFQYFFSLNIIGSISGLFSKDNKLDIIVEENDANDKENGNLNEANYKPMPTDQFNKLNKQVFNIPGNYYNYDDASAICKAYGGNLASYKQIEDAYKRGGEWCNYGWSDEQMALFPTQQNTYDNLQNKKDHQHDCGRPGINGGYIANPNVKFGVNCYGYKPKITEEEEELMKTITPYPETKEEQDFQTRVDFWKNKINSVLLSPFNYTSWEEI